MKFHPLHYDFFMVNRDNKIVSCPDIKRLSAYEPLFYIERNNKKILFGDIYKSDNKFYVLLSLNNFPKESKFHYFQFCQILLMQDGKNLNYWKVHSYSKEIESVTNNQINDIIINGKYIGNLFLQEVDCFIDTIYNHFKHFVNLNMNQLTRINTEKFLIHLKKENKNSQINMDLFFEDKKINLFNRDDWEEGYKRKDEDFEVSVYLPNFLYYTIEFNLRNLYEQHNLNEFIDNDEIKNYMNQNLITGQFIIGTHDLVQSLEKINNCHEGNKLVINKNSRQTIYFNQKHKKENLSYFKEIYISIMDSGHPVMNSLSGDFYRERPLISIFNESTKVINKYDKEHMKYYLKVI